MRMRIAAFGVVVIALVVVGWAATGLRQKQGAQAQVSQVQTSQAHESRVSLMKVEDMFCAGCAVAVQAAAKKVAGVDEVKVDHEKGTAEITYDPSKTSAQTIASAITKGTGFKTEVVETGSQL